MKNRGEMISLEYDMEKQGKPRRILPPDEMVGINHLTTDNMIYDCLRRCQETDELLQAFYIRYLDESFEKEPSNLDMNMIYVVREGSTLIQRNTDSHEFEANLAIVITLRKYSTVDGQKILKTMYKDILHHLVNDEVFDYVTVESFDFEYREPGYLYRGIISFSSIELENFCYDYDPEPVKILLGLKTSIMGTNERRFKLKELKRKEIKDNHR